jgi:hypothetical protein
MRDPAHRLSVVEQRLDIHKVVEACRKELAGARDGLTSNHTAFEKAYWAMKGSYNQLYAQHEKALKDLTAQCNNNQILKNDIWAAQSWAASQDNKAKAYQDRIAQLEGENTDLSLRLEQSPTEATQCEEEVAPEVNERAGSCKGQRGRRDIRGRKARRCP